MRYYAEHAESLLAEEIIGSAATRSGIRYEPLGTVLAVMIIQVISSGLNIFGVNRFVINVIMGGILILVLALNLINTGKKANA